MEVRGPGARLEGGTFEPGAVGQPEGTVGTALQAREAEKGGRARTACLAGFNSPDPGPARLRSPGCPEEEGEVPNPAPSGPLGGLTREQRPPFPSAGAGSGAQACPPAVDGRVSLVYLV